ncbi:alpha/beta fold hydrolase [Paradevosia shaoguanensis]|uniref:alpha/beta fold hydrolase n=1 Tax=Paradevosia shaoguanensis TaxID=1335043 RepID=UPI003C71673B
MNVVVDPNGPPLAATPSNPVPEGARAGYFVTSDNVRLRYALFPRKGEVPRGTVCILQGRAEFIEKYFETIADFQARGFAVATFDFRGQGGSERVVPGRLGYVDRFEDYWTDLRSFHAGILLPDCPPPFYLVAHSMGGLVALDAGRRDRLMFDRLFLSAPMIALEGVGMSMAGASRLANVLSFLGLGRLPLPGHDKPMVEKTFPGNPLTGDRARYLRNGEVLAAQPKLATGAPTIRWAAAATEMMGEAARDRFPGSVRIPVLMLAAARDRVVSTPAIEQLGLRMRTGRHIVIPGAQHELFMETDPIRGQVLAAFDAFITEQSG